MKSWTIVDPRDNVAAVLKEIKAGTTLSVNDQSIMVPNSLAPKQKFTLVEMPPGHEVLMYGVTVGVTIAAVQKGEALTTKNVSYSKHAVDQSIRHTYRWSPPDVQTWKDRRWMGYRREDGRYGTRNNWLVIPLVFCENQNVAHMQKAMEEALGYGKIKKKYAVDLLIEGWKRGLSANELRVLKPGATDHGPAQRTFQNVDGLKFITHQSGCGGTRGDSESFSALVAGYLAHPNCAGATILSLGCQNAQMKGIRDKLKSLAPNYDRKIVWLEQQGLRAEQDFLELAIVETFIGLTEANKYTRTEAPLSALSIGLECGGSDGFSGISANPLLGHVSDIINALGGISILSEFPELSGVEQSLIDRCLHQSDADRFVQLMKRYEQILEKAGSSFEANPSPGNIREGLITGAMKSAGAARKGGTAPISAVLDYTEPALKPGLNLLCTPGNDVESTTALVGSGANMVLFTTGMGTPTGNPLSPVLKVSSNSKLASQMPEVIDFDAGPLIEGLAIDDMGQILLEHIIEVASGTLSKAEALCQDDFIPWKRDISL